MSRKVTIVMILLGFLFLANLAFATKMKSHWVNPTATAANLQFKNVLVVAVIKQEFTRKIAEDKLVSILEAGGAAHAVPSYILLGNADLDNREAAKEKVAAMNFDGAIILRYAGEKEDRKYDPTATDRENENPWDPFSDFWGYYWTSWGAIYNAVTPNELTVYIETLVYSMKDNKLVWSGITETRDPKNPAKVVAEIAEETGKVLQKEGLIAKKK